jgi:Flp pilus assembly protein TadB
MGSPPTLAGAVLAAILAVAAAVTGEPTIALVGVAGAVIFAVWALRDARRGRI